MTSKEKKKKIEKERREEEEEEEEGTKSSYCRVKRDGEVGMVWW